MAEDYQEKDLERKLVDHVAKFLVEPGAGFAYVARQYHVVVGEGLSGSITRSFIQERKVRTGTCREAEFLSVSGG